MAGLLQERLSDDDAPKKKRNSQTREQMRDNRQDSIVQRKRRKETNHDEDEQQPNSVSKAADKYYKNKYQEDEDYLGREKTFVSESDMEELKVLDDLSSEEQIIRSEKKKKFIQRISMIVMSFVCIYIVMLIYGTFVTEYEYDETGALAPIKMSVEDISNKNEYIELVGYYMQTRALYERILNLDYRVANQIEESVTLGGAYEELIEDIDAVVVQIEASTIGSKYNQILQMLHTFTNNYLVSYCQYMSVALVQNDEEAANQAIMGRATIESAFKTITADMVTYGENIKGYDITNIKEWSPEGYVAESIIGIKE
jgi:hypothetical protein